MFGLTSILLVGSMVVYSLLWSYKNRPWTQAWITANANYQLGEFGTANQIYHTLWPHLKMEGAYLQMAGKSLSMKRQFYFLSQYLELALYFSSDPVIFTTLGKDYTLFGKVELEKYDRAEFLLKLAKYMQPGHYFPRYLLIQLYEKTEQEEKKKAEAVALLALETKVNSQAVDEMRMAARGILNLY